MTREERLTSVRIAKLKVMMTMLDHMQPDLQRLDKTSAHVMSMLLLALKEKLHDIESKK
jgi:hypothetical protein